MYVYISEICQQETKLYQIEQKIEELANWVKAGSRQDFFKLFEIFQHPYYVRKGVGYRYRLLAKMLDVPFEGKNYQIVVFFRLFLRGDDDYKTLFHQADEHGDFFYNQQHLDSKIADYVVNLANPTHKPTAKLTSERINQSDSLVYLIQTKTNLLQLSQRQLSSEYYQEGLGWHSGTRPFLTQAQLHQTYQHIQQGLDSLEPQIFEIDDNDQKEENAIDPYYKKLLYRVSTMSLIQQGYLTPLEIPNTTIAYDDSNLKMRGGSFTKESLDQAFVGQGRKTADIVADIVNRGNAINAEGILIFASTVDHGHEIMASLPSYNSAFLTGQTPKAERERIIDEYKAKRIKYLVSIIITTRGFNAPHTNAVAVLRPTESARLLIQMIGRCIRLYEGKEKAYYWDYAGNYNRFAEKSGNIFEPDIQAFGENIANRVRECLLHEKIDDDLLPYVEFLEKELKQNIEIHRIEGIPNNHIYKSVMNDSSSFEKSQKKKVRVKKQEFFHTHFTRHSRE